MTQELCNNCGKEVKKAHTLQSMLKNAEDAKDFLIDFHSDLDEYRTNDVDTDDNRVQSYLKRAINNIDKAISFIEKTKSDINRSR